MQQSPRRHVVGPRLRKGFDHRSSRAREITNLLGAWCITGGVSPAAPASMPWRTFMRAILSAFLILATVACGAAPALAQSAQYSLATASNSELRQIGQALREGGHV